MFTERNRLTGILHLRIYRNGKLAEEVVLENLITNRGLDHYAKCQAGDAGAKPVAKVAVGEGTGAPQKTDTALTNPFAKAVDGVTFPATGQAAYAFTIATDEANGLSIQEFGLVDDTETVLHARRLKAIGIKDSSMSIEGTWTTKVA